MVCASRCAAAAQCDDARNWRRCGYLRCCSWPRPGQDHPGPASGAGIRCLGMGQGGAKNMVDGRPEDPMGRSDHIESSLPPTPRRSAPHAAAGVGGGAGARAEVRLAQSPILPTLGHIRWRPKRPSPAAPGIGRSPATPVVESAHRSRYVAGVHSRRKAVACVDSRLSGDHRSES